MKTKRTKILLKFINKFFKSLLSNFIIYALIFVFISCSTKEYLVSKPPYFSFEKLSTGKKYMIRVHKDDALLYSNYIELLKGKIEFCNKQIDDYNHFSMELEKSRKKGL